MAPLCPAHAWKQAFDECPYGIHGMGDVTWPDYAKAKALGAPVQEEFDAPPWFLAICVFWGYVPYFLALLAVTRLLVWNSCCCGLCLAKLGLSPERASVLSFRRHGTKELAYALLLGVIVAGNELIVKRLVKQPRPGMSCLLSCGMPSSHSSLSIGTLMLGFLDFWLRMGARQSAGAMLQVWEAQQLPAGKELPAYRSVWMGFKQLLYDSMLSLQFTNFDEPSSWDFLGYAAAWVCLMLPVPYSRVQLSDHTTLQVFAGSCVGVAASIAWFSFLRWQQRRNNHLLGKRWPSGTSWGWEHNYALPCSTALLRCNPFSISPRPGYGERFKRCGGSDGKEPAFPWLQEAIQELEWYWDQTLQRRAEMAHIGTLTQLEETYLTARQWRLHAALELLRLELWLADEVLPADFDEGQAKSFLAHVVMPKPQGMGVQARSMVARLGEKGLQQAWLAEWDSEGGQAFFQRLLGRCGECQAAPAGAPPSPAAQVDGMPPAPELPCAPLTPLTAGPPPHALGRSADTA